MKPETRDRLRWEVALFGSIAICIGILIVSEIGHMRLQTGYNMAVAEMRASAQLGALQTALNEAETGQRGFMLTRRATYLEPYKAALPKITNLLGELSAYFRGTGDTAAQADFSALVTLIGQKVSEMELTTGLVRQGRDDTAEEITRSDIGKEKMDLIRQKAAGLQQREHERAAGLIGTWEFNRNLSRFSVALVTVLNITLLIWLFRWLRRDHESEARKKQAMQDEQDRLDRLVRQRTEQLDTLATHIQQVSENEKTLIARELHDELGAILTASKMDVTWVRQRLSTEQQELGDKLARALKNLDQGVQAKRRIIENLRPSSLTNLGLVTALREYVEQAAEQNSWELTLDLPEESLRLPEEVSIALFRICQEALNNAAKYAAARALTVRLRRAEGQVHLMIEDNGRGFAAGEVRPKSHGLAGMRQRMMGLNGSLEISSEPGRGTTVHAALPSPELPAEDESEEAIVEAAMRRLAA